MTVSTTTLRNDYTGNGSTTAFTGGFYILDASHVKVIRTDTTTGLPTTLTLNSDYTVTNMTSIGFTVNMTTAPTSTQKLTLLRDVPLTQLTHYVPNDPFPAASHENALDQLTMEAQQMQEEISRALTLPEQLTGISATLPTPSAGLCLKWASDGKSIINSAYDPDVEASNAATSASQAATSASNASTSASQAATSATNAGNSASQAATSASNAQAAASSIGFKNVKFLTHANSPYAVQPGDTGYLLSVDTSGGNVVLNLPAISGLTLPVSYGFKKSTNDANTLTLNCGGTDTFDSGSASKTIDSGGAGTTLTPENTTTPDKWVTSDWGTLAGQSKYQQFSAGTDFTAGTTTSLTLTNSPLPASATDIRLYFDGGFQQHSEWSYNPTTGVITFTSVIPAGVSKVEADWATPLVVGTPADGTVTGAKMASGDAANIRTAIGLVPGTAAGDVLVLDGSAKIPAVDGSQLTHIHAIGVDQTWQDMTASRAIGTTYTNNTGRSIGISVVFVQNAVSGGLSLTVGGQTIDYNISQAGSNANATIGRGIVIPPGATYSVANVGTASTLTKWFELR